MGFDATGLVQPLDYKGMAELGIPDGTIPEPTNEALTAYFEAIVELTNSGPEATGTEILAKVHQAASDLCSGTPSAAQFAALPPRLFREFAKWLTAEFIDPKG